MSLHKKAIECGITSSCRDENESLFRRIIAGKKAARRLVEGNMAYVVSKVENFLDEFPDYRYLKDDLISEGFLVVARISRVIEQQGEVSEDCFNPQGLLSVSLRNQFLTTIDLERNVPLTEAVANTLVRDDTAAQDLMLDILSCCEDGREEKIIRLRCEGLTDKQIGPEVGLTKMHVSRLRQKIYERFQEKQEQ
jgi:DNA-directed RNA polymerase specialized sigma subunit